MLLIIQICIFYVDLDYAALLFIDRRTAEQQTDGYGISLTGL